MSSRKTKRQSGAFYRRERSRKTEELSKQAGALTKYFRSANTKPKEAEMAKSHSQFDYSEAQSSTSATSTDIPVNIDPMDAEFEETARLLPSPTSLIDLSDPESEDEIKEVEDFSQMALDVDDPGTWPTLLTNKIIDILIEQGPKQITNFNFPVDESGRKFSPSYYIKTLVNDEKISRDWLCYSKKLNRIFCFACKLFSKDNTGQIVTTGFFDWRQCSDYLNKHEIALKHVNSVKSWCELKMRLEKVVLLMHNNKMFIIEKKSDGVLSLKE